MPASKSAQVVISNTRKVDDALQQADDFMTVAQLCEATKLSPKAVMTALRWLVEARAAESIAQQGHLYFMASPETDTRVRTYDQHRKEDEPRIAKRGRRSRKVAPPSLPMHEGSQS